MSAERKPREQVRVALYARYSSDNQRETSIEDQFRTLRDYAKKQRWSIVEEFSDYETSGKSTLTRPGFQALMQTAKSRTVDVVLSEGLDRLNRNLKDSADLFERLTFQGVDLYTLAEGGKVSQMHVAFKGMQNEQYTVDLRDKTRRGQHGAVLRGQAVAGLSYGYRAVQGFDQEGDVITGKREIHDAEAAIVKRIFKMYIAGASSKVIAKTLNAEGVPGPRGSKRWNPSTIHGNAERGLGILHNELYVGRMVWNRQRWLVDPATGTRVSRMNPKDEWITRDVPKLRILSDAVWDAARTRGAEVTARYLKSGGRPVTLRNQYLLSGLLKCGECGAGYVMHSNGRLACHAHKKCGTCTNNQTIERGEVEQRIMAALQHKLVTKERFAEFCRTFTEETNKLRAAQGANVDNARRELERVRTALEMQMQMALQGYDCKDAYNANKVKERTLVSELENVREAKPLLHPKMADVFQKAITELAQALVAKKVVDRATTDHLRALIQEVKLTPNKKTGKPDVLLVGDVAGILKLASGGKIEDFAPETKGIAGVRFDLGFRIAA